MEINFQVKNLFTRTRYRNLGRFCTGKDSLKEHYLLVKQITVKRFQKSAIFGKDLILKEFSEPKRKKKCPTLHLPTLHLYLARAKVSQNDQK